MAEFFGEYDLLGNPIYTEPHGKLTIFNDRFTQCRVNMMDNGVDLVFNGTHGISELIARLTLLRDEMIKMPAKKPWYF